MTAQEILAEILRLPPEEREKLDAALVNENRNLVPLNKTPEEDGDGETRLSGLAHFEMIKQQIRAMNGRARGIWGPDAQETINEGRKDRTF